MAEIATDLSELYRDYYAGKDGLAIKRELSARDTVRHIRRLSDNPLGKMIDVGAGNGSVLAEVERTGIANEMWAVEISQSGVDRINDRSLRTLKEVRLFDGYAIPYPDQYFDTAICIHVLEHVEHERILLRELARIARTIYIEVPLEGGWRGRIDRRFGHINYYRPMTFLNLVETSGLRVTRHHVNTSSLAYERFCSGRLKGTVKGVIRQTALKLSKRITPEFLTYLLTVKCAPHPPT